MQLSTSILKDIVSDSLDNCVQHIKKKGDISSRKWLRHRQIGSIWIRCLSLALKERILNGNGEYIIYPDVNEDLAKVGENRFEYLFDIIVGKKAKTTSKRGHCPNYFYISKPMLAVESEFSRRCEKAVEDFAKLICVNSLYRIFVGPYYSETDERDKNYLDPLINIAKQIPGIKNLYLVLVSHPEDLNKYIIKYRILQLVDNNWIDVVKPK